MSAVDEDAARDGSAWSINPNYLNYYAPPLSNSTRAKKSHIDQTQSIAHWQENFCNEQTVFLQFQNANTGAEFLMFPVKTVPDTRISFEFQGGTDFPRLVLKMSLTNKAKGKDHNRSLFAVFPAWGNEGTQYPRDTVRIEPGKALEHTLRNSQASDGTFTFSDSLQNLRYAQETLGDQYAKRCNLSIGRRVEVLHWATEVPPICGHFEGDLSKDSGFTLAQVNLANHFKKIRCPETKLTVVTTFQTHLYAYLRLLTAMPSPVYPPFPLVDARYNPALKALNPIWVKNIASVTTGATIQHYGQRKQDWTFDFENSLVTTEANRRLVPMEPTEVFLSKRHYEAIQMLGLAREVQYQNDNLGNIFNRRYVFEMQPIPNVNTSEFLVYLNVRPTSSERLDTEMKPPEPGTRVRIELTLGLMPRTSVGDSPASSTAGSRAGSRRGTITNTMVDTRATASRGVRSGSATMSSATSVVRSRSGTARSRTGSITPLPDVERLSLTTDVSGAVSTFTGPTIEKEVNPTTWEGIVVSNPEKGNDDYDICIYLRVSGDGSMIISDWHQGFFTFGRTHSAPYSQAEQAVRLAMHGDLSYYQIPPNSWIQWLLLGLENASIYQQGLGQTRNQVFIHPRYQQPARKLNPSQSQAFNAAISNGTAQGTKTNHYIAIIKGPPGTGKTLVLACVAYHCYQYQDEKLLFACGTNRALDNAADAVQKLLPKQTARWTVPQSVEGVYRLETEWDESYSQIERNATAYQHEVLGEEEYDKHASLDPSLESVLRNRNISNEALLHVKNYVKRRLMTNRPLSLGDHILRRVDKAREEGSQWRDDYGNKAVAEEEYVLLWRFISYRKFAQMQNMQFLDILGESSAQRKERFDQLDEHIKKFERESTKAWRDLQAFYIKRAKIIFCTASTAGRRVLKSFRATRVIVEEAGQLDEPNTLNAWVRHYSNLRKVILSGDPDQLAPPVLALMRNEAGRNRSLSQMERLIATGVKSIELNVQYRMHPDIGHFISNQFYNGRISNHASTELRPWSTAFRIWVERYCRDLGKPIAKGRNSFFISVSDTAVYHRKHADSLCNLSYIDRLHHAVMHMINFLKNGYSQDLTDPQGNKLTVAVACFYTEELSLLKKWFLEVEQLEGLVEVVTIDSAQGREWDVLFLSTCRPGGEWGLGFVSDRRRHNVGCSRARMGQVTVGHRGMGGLQSSKKSQGFEAWNGNWAYHHDNLKCFLEVKSGFSDLQQELRVNPNDYEKLPFVRARHHD